MIGDVLQTKRMASLCMGLYTTSEGGRCRTRSLCTRIIGYPDFLERVPLSTCWTLAYPLLRLLAAVRAYVDNLVFCHSIAKIDIKVKKEL